MRRQLWWSVGLVLLVIGVVLVLTARTEPTGFSWFAYAPSESSDWSMSWGDADGMVLVVSRGQLVGGAVAVAGLLAIVSGVGYRLGRRRTARGDAGPA